MEEEKEGEATEGTEEEEEDERLGEKETRAFDFDPGEMEGEEEEFLSESASVSVVAPYDRARPLLDKTDIERGNFFVEPTTNTPPSSPSPPPPTPLLFPSC